MIINQWHDTYMLLKINQTTIIVLMLNKISKKKKKDNKCNKCNK